MGEYMGCLRAWYPRQDTFVTIALLALCVLTDKSILRGRTIGLTLSASFTDRGTNDCASGSSLSLFGPFGCCKTASDPGNAESLKAASDPGNAECRSR
jgi:hypothetical protein